MAHYTIEELDPKEMEIVEELPYVHKVGIPTRQNLFQEIKATVKETIFPDDPFRQFKGQTPSKKFMLVRQSIFPISEWGRDYNLIKLKGDIIAGLTISSLAVPQDIGYAKLSSLAPQYGLYTSFVPPLIYAFMGSSRDIAIGPVAAVSLLMGTLLRNEINPITNAAEYTRLAFTATFFAGITQFALGFFRLGFLIDFLSHATIVGFMAGAAITIGLQQLKGFLGMLNFTSNTDIVSVMQSVFYNAPHGWSWQNALIGASFLTFLLCAKYIVSATIHDTTLMEWRMNPLHGDLTCVNPTWVLFLSYLPLFTLIMAKSGTGVGSSHVI